MTDTFLPPTPGWDRVDTEGVVPLLGLSPNILWSDGGGAAGGAINDALGHVDLDATTGLRGVLGAERGTADEHRHRLSRGRAGWWGGGVAHAIPSFLIRSRLLASMRSTALSDTPRSTAISAWE